MPLLSNSGRNVLESLEGLRLEAYTDEAGVWTIGYGHTGPDVVPGLLWSRDLADSVLAVDVQKFAAGVTKLVTAPLGQNQFDALVIFAYNIGLAAFASSTALRMVNSGEFDQVPDAIKMWCKVHDPNSGLLVISPGLAARRFREISLWNTPDA